MITPMNNLKCICEDKNLTDPINITYCSNCKYGIHNFCYDIVLQEKNKEFYCVNCRIILNDPFIIILNHLSKTQILPQNKSINISLEVFLPSSAIEEIKNRNCRLAIWCTKIKIKSKDSKKVNQFLFSLNFNHI